MNNADQAIGVVLDILNVAINLTAELQKVSDMLVAARADGRDITNEELASLKDARLKARQAALDA